MPTEMPKEIRSIEALWYFAYSAPLFKESYTVERAAMELGLRHGGNLSAMLKKVHEVLGDIAGSTRLFEGDTRPKRLTAEGEQIASRLRSLFERLKDDIRHHQSVIGVITIATLDYCISYLLPRLLQPFLERQRSVPIRYMEMEAEGIIEAVAVGRVDFGIGLKPDTYQARGPGYEIGYVLIFPESSTGAFTKSKMVTSLHSVKGTFFLARATIDPLRDYLPDGVRIIDVDHFAQVLAHVRSGLGVGIVPEVMVERVDSFMSLPLCLTGHKEDFTTDTLHVLRPSTPLSEPANELATFLEKNLAKDPSSS